MNTNDPGIARLSLGATVNYTALTQEQASEFSRDWRNAVAAMTELTQDGRAGLAEIPPAIVEHVQAAVSQVTRDGGDLVLQFDDRTPHEGGGRFMARPGHPRVPKQSQPTLKLVVTIFHCHFDANFRNWHCYLGPHRKGE